MTAIAAPTRFRVAVKGRADHSEILRGMGGRDALTAASELILAEKELQPQRLGKELSGTVGYINVVPGAMNVIPGGKF